VVYPRPAPVNLKAIKWEILVRDSAYMCLSPADYEDLSTNWAEVVRYIKDLQDWGSAYESERLR
jgi:hypothetical protein